MTRPTQAPWVRPLFFRLTMAAALALLASVLLAPLVDALLPAGAGSTRVVTLFARDATLRRTTLASALGLMVTACVFFRGPVKPVRPATRRGSAPPPPSVAGA